jgi:Tol biopolymer transport system component
MVTPPDRRFRSPWLAVAALLALTVWAARPAAATGTLVGISMSAQASVAASGELDCCKQQRMSPDGRWVVFRSYGTELVNGYTGSGYQIYLFDRQTGQVRLVSGAGGSPTQGAGTLLSRREVVSADGAFVAFDSDATDLVAGGSGPASANVYLWERATGRVILVSASTAAAGQRGNANSTGPVMSADGAFVAFVSSATDLVAGGSGPGSTNVYLWERATGTMTLVSESTTATGQRGDNQSFQPVMSADGAFVAFTSEATDLVAGGSGPGGTQNVYLWERATGTATLVSESTAATGQRSSGSSPLISGNGAFVAFLSSATDLVAGGSGPVNPNVYLWERATGTVTLVSESTTAAGQRGNRESYEPVISADGAFVAFFSPATDLVAGGGPVQHNVYLWERATGTTTLVSESTTAAGQRGNNSSTTPAISANGAFVAFTSSATDLVTGGSGGGTRNVYRWERATGTVTLVSESTAAAGQRGDKQSLKPAISGDGAFVAFQSDATDLVAGDTQFTDVLVAEVATGGMVVASRRAPDIPWFPRTANNQSFTPSMSADGAFVAFTSSAADLVAGSSGPTPVLNVYLWERATGIVTLVSHAAAAAGQRGNNQSYEPVMSADGAFVAFTSYASDLVAGSSGPAPILNIYLWERATGIVTLVSHAAAAAGQRGGGLSSVISAAGDFVAFLSYSTDLVAGGSGPATENVYLWERATGTVTLVSESAAVAGQRGNGPSSWSVISADGAFVAFDSNATDLVSGGGPATSNVYLYERATGSLTLVSGSTAVAGQRGNGNSGQSVISADGAFVAFASAATDLVLGGSGPATGNVYLWERATGTATLVSQSIFLPGQRGNDSSSGPVINADGAFVAFHSSATDLIAVGSGPEANNVYLWERATGTVTLISESTAAAGQRGNDRSSTPAISADGAFVAFRSLATDLVAGGSGPATGRPDGDLPQPPMPFNVYLWERATGAVTLVSQSTAGAGQRGNSESSGPVISADGASVAFSSLSSDLIARDLNGQSDVFYWSAPVPGIAVTPASGLVTTEGGGSDTFTVVLTTEPTGDVVIDVVSTELNEGIALPAQLTFTGGPTGNWATPRTVTVTGVDDEFSDGDQGFSVTLAVDSAASADPRYAALAPSTVALTNLDDEAPGGSLFADGFESGDTDRWSHGAAALVAADYAGERSALDRKGEPFAAYQITSGDDAPAFALSTRRLTGFTAAAWFELGQLGRRPETLLSLTNDAGEAVLTVDTVDTVDTDGGRGARPVIHLHVNGDAFYSQPLGEDLVDSEWYHIAFIYDGAAGTLDYYLDGALQARLVGLPGVLRAAQAQLGAGPAGAVDGAIYDALWVPYPLTAKQIAALATDSR